MPKPHPSSGNTRTPERIRAQRPQGTRPAVTAGSARPAETRAVGALTVHADAALIPWMRADEYSAFVDEIQRSGILTPIEITAAGVVLNGRHRLKAAQQLGHEQVPVRLVAPADELAYMVGQALHHRHLSQSQRAALALELFDLTASRERSRTRQQQNLRHNEGGAEVATLPPRGKTRETIARACGVSARVIQDAITVHDADPLLLQQVKNGSIAVHQAARRVRRQQRDTNLAPAPPLPDGPFEIVYADPPWRLGNPDGPHAPEQHYPTMTLEEIASEKIPAADDALLYLWAVNSLLPEAIEIIRAWGFTYKTYIAWVKDGIGPGVWTRPCCELLLLARRGSYPPPDGPDRPANVIQAPRRGHSKKPDQAYQLIERSYPNATRIELFARNRRPGWTSWGNQLLSQDGDA